MSVEGIVAWTVNVDGKRKVDERVGRKRYDQTMHGTSHPGTSRCMRDTVRQARRMKRWRGRTGELRSRVWRTGRRDNVKHALDIVWDGNIQHDWSLFVTKLSMSRNRSRYFTIGY